MSKKLSQHLIKTVLIKKTQYTYTYGPPVKVFEVLHCASNQLFNVIPTRYFRQEFLSVVPFLSADVSNYVAYKKRVDFSCNELGWSHTRFSSYFSPLYISIPIQFLKLQSFAWYVIDWNYLQSYNIHFVDLMDFPVYP